MNVTLRNAVCLALGVMLLHGFVRAKAAEQSWSAEASAGLQYDSKVIVEETDVASDDGAREAGSVLLDDRDGASIFDLRLDYEIDLDSDTSLELGYNFALAKYFEYTNFDRQIHNVTGILRHQFGAVNAGASYGLYHARLDGEGFLTLHRASPYVSFRPGSNTYLWLSYAYSDYDLIGRTARDADAHQLYADLYYFLDGTSRYFRIGYEIRDAKDGQFSFDGNSLKAGFVTALPLGERESSLNIGYEFEHRNYEGITPSIGDRRDDSRHTLTGAFEFELSERWHALLAYRYRDSASNLAVADYEEQRIELRLGFTF